MDMCSLRYQIIVFFPSFSLSYSLNKKYVGRKILDIIYVMNDFYITLL